MKAAVVQFAVSGSIDDNAQRILEALEEARDRGARIALFPEGSLGGYAGADVPSFRGYPWERQERRLGDVRAACGRLGIAAIVGTNTPRAGGRPHNSLAAIDARGRLVLRYDKRFCTEPDHRHYAPGRRPGVFLLDGVRCAVLICHEWRYPELYREYGRLGIRVVFQAWYDGGLGPRDFRREGRLLGEVIEGTVRGHAACNALWICASNTSRPESCFGSFVARPDGSIAGRLPRNRPGVRVVDLDLRARFPDPSRRGRERLLSHSACEIRSA